MRRQRLFCWLFLFTCINILPVNASPSSKQTFQQALNLLENNHLKKSGRLFEKILNEEFGHYPSTFNSAIIHLLNNDYDKALQLIAEAKKLNPYDIRVEHMFALAYYQKGDADSTKKHLDAILLKNPTDIFTHKTLGLIYLKEAQFDAAIREFSMVKNLTSCELDSNLLLSLAHALTGKYAVSLQKISPIANKLSDPDHLLFYAFLLEQNDQVDKAKLILKDIYKSNNKNMLGTLVNKMDKAVINAQRNQLIPIDIYENPTITERIVSEIKKNNPFQAPTPHPSKKNKITSKPLPLNLSGTFKQTWELFARNPKFTSPINGLNTTSNLKLKARLNETLELSSETEWFYNRWDNTQLNFFKMNLGERNNHEIDIGKFSSKHFPSLVSYPTVDEGVRIWKQFKLRKFENSDFFLPSEDTNIDTLLPVNLGKLYQNHYIDRRLFKSTEITALSGRTLRSIDLNERKEKNETTLETSGQFEQWVQAYRLTTKVNGFLELGASTAITRDRQDSAVVSSSTTPISSQAFGVDGALKLLDQKLTLDWDVAVGNFDENLIDNTNKHLQDTAWIIKTKYTPIKPLNISYEQKQIGKNFKVEGAYQTEDRLTREISLRYQPLKPKPWSLKALSIKYTPEVDNYTGGGDSKRHYATFQSTIDIQLPQNAKYVYDYKYYSQVDKCDCNRYTTVTLTNSLDWEIKSLKTTIKPKYTFERKNDMIAAPTDEKKKEYVLSIVNNTLDKFELKYSYEYENKSYHGVTNKNYTQFIHTFEGTYSFIPRRSLLKIKISRDLKRPTDTNKTDISSAEIGYEYSTKDRNRKLYLAYERKNNIYIPWSDTSAYRENYYKVDYTQKF